MHLVDVLILTIGLVAIFDGVRRGLLSQVFELGGFVAALATALVLFRPAADFLVHTYHTPVLVAKPAAFFVIWLLIEFATAALWYGVGQSIPAAVKESWWNRAVGAVPSLIKSGAIVGVMATLLVSLPLAFPLKDALNQSALAGGLMRFTGGLTRWMERTIGTPFSDTFNFITTPNEPGSGVVIPRITDPNRLQLVPVLEAQMLDLINAERATAGVGPLAADPAAQEVARAHSRDMWLRGYFSHTNPDGQDPFDRMTAAGLTYDTAGENLALAPSLAIAHDGLMRSPGHRANILEPAFGRVGIGIVSAGAEGLMITQNYRD